MTDTPTDDPWHCEACQRGFEGPVMQTRSEPPAAPPEPACPLCGSYTAIRKVYDPTRSWEYKVVTADGETLDTFGTRASADEYAVEHAREYGILHTARVPKEDDDA